MSEKAIPNWRPGFWSLIVTQFQGAFNDNALKFLVIYLIVERNFPQPCAIGCSARRRALRSALHFIFAHRRISRRPLQQALGHHRHEAF